MTTQAPSREITIKSKDAVRWERPLNRALGGFLFLILCINFATWNAPPIVHTILGLVFIGGFASLIGVAVVLGLKSNRFVQHYRLVFALHWTEPKRIKRYLARLEFREKSFHRFTKVMILFAVLNSFMIGLIWLLSWATSKLDPSKEPLSLARVGLLLATMGVGPSILGFVVYILSMLLSSRTIGLDDEWMGFVQGQPGQALWRYDQIATVLFKSVWIGEQEGGLMIVIPREGREVAFGLSDEVDVRRVANFLADKGVEVLGV